MNIALIGFGKTGINIVEQYRRFEARTRKHVADLSLAVDSAAKPLDELSRVDEENQLLIGRRRLEGRGARKDLTKGVSAVKKNSGNIIQYTDSLSQYDLDAFVVAGSLAGGTGGAASVIANALANRYDNPVYGVGILPSRHEPPQYKLNAAKSIKAFSEVTDNLILADNTHLDVAQPKHYPDCPDDRDHNRMFSEANQKIGRALHFLFTADELSTPSRLEGSTITTQEIHETLQSGGLSTFCYAAKKLPMPARPGILGRAFEIAEYFRWRGTPFQSSQNKRQWPHPTTLAPEALTPSNSIIKCQPTRSSRNLFVLIGPRRQLSWNSPANTTEWAQKNTQATHTFAGNYPTKTKKAASLILCSDLPVPQRVIELQENAKKIKDHREKIEETTPNPREKNVLEDVTPDISSIF